MLPVSTGDAAGHEIGPNRDSLSDRLRAQKTFLGSAVSVPSLMQRAGTAAGRRCTTLRQPGREAGYI